MWTKEQLPWHSYILFYFQKIELKKHTQKRKCSCQVSRPECWRWNRFFVYTFYLFIKFNIIQSKTTFRQLSSLNLPLCLVTMSPRIENIFQCQNQAIDMSYSIVYRLSSEFTVKKIFQNKNQFFNSLLYTNCEILCNHLLDNNLKAEPTFKMVIKDRWFHLRVLLPLLRSDTNSCTNPKTLTFLAGLIKPLLLSTQTAIWNVSFALHNKKVFVDFFVHPLNENVQIKYEYCWVVHM